MDLGRLRFFLGEVLTNFTRNAGMQFTAIGTVAVTIVLLGAFLFVRDTIQTFGNGVLSQIEIAVYLKDLPAPASEDGRLPHPDDRTMAAGQALYLDNCTACHTGSGVGAANLFPRLAGSATVQASDPDHHFAKCLDPFPARLATKKMVARPLQILAMQAVVEHRAGRDPGAALRT